MALIQSVENVWQMELGDMDKNPSRNKLPVFCDNDKSAINFFLGRCYSWATWTKHKIAF
jgi:hypothetical protein